MVQHAPDSGRADKQRCMREKWRDGWGETEKEKERQGTTRTRSLVAILQIDESKHLTHGVVDRVTVPVRVLERGGSKTQVRDNNEI